MATVDRPRGGSSVGGDGVGGTGAGSSPGAAPFGAPAGTTIRFVLLIAVVAVGGIYTYDIIYYLVPGQLQSYLLDVWWCRQSVPGNDRSYNTEDPAQARAYEAIQQATEACAAPVFQGRALWLVWGTVLLFATAVLLYWVIPLLIIRRSRLRPLGRSHVAVPALDRLSRRMGLPHPPVWLLARPRGTGGQAFGRLGRRYVSLDVGLVIRLARGDPEAEAVVLHELAHLRNRDVDKTYLAIAVWWSFVVLALAPLVVFAAYHLLPWTTPTVELPPDLSIAGLEGPASATLERRVTRFVSGRTLVFLLADPYVLAFVPVLAVLSYLARNAVLRAREVEADATVARDPAAAACLASLLDARAKAARRARTAGASRWAVFRTHPHPPRRAALLSRPDLALRPSLTEFALVGALVGLFAVNLQLVLESHLLVTFRRINTLAADLLVGLLTGPLLVGLLAVSLWRSAAASRRPSPAGAPFVLTAGFLVGSLLPWLVHRLGLSVAEGAGNGVALMRPETVVVTGSLLTAGILVVSAWLLSVTHGVLPGERLSRWAMPAVLGAAVLGATAWFAVWYAFRDTDVQQTWQPFFPIGTAPAGDWYASWAHWSGVTFPVLEAVTENPLTLPGLVLLWSVPTLVSTETARDLRAPLIAGAAGGLVVIVVGGVALPFAAGAALPETVRHGGAAGEPWSFPFVYWQSYLWTVIAAQAAVAAVTAGLCRRLRPALVLLAVSLTGLFGAMGAFVTSAVAGRIDLFGSGRTLAVLPRLPSDLHGIAVRGVVVAVPAALLGLAIAVIVRHLRGRALPSAVPPGRSAAPHPGRARLVRAALAVLALSYLTAAAVHAPDAVAQWLTLLDGPTAAGGSIAPTGP